MFIQYQFDLADHFNLIINKTLMFGPETSFTLGKVKVFGPVFSTLLSKKTCGTTYRCEINHTWLQNGSKLGKPLITTFSTLYDTNSILFLVVSRIWTWRTLQVGYSAYRLPLQFNLALKNDCMHETLIYDLKLHSHCKGTTWVCTLFKFSICS